MTQPHRHLAAASMMVSLALSVLILSALSVCGEWGALAMIPVLLLLMLLGRRGRE